MTFVNLQYGNVTAELQSAEEKFGVTIHNFGDLDLRNDLDGAAALTDACDLVISAPTRGCGHGGGIGP